MKNLVKHIEDFSAVNYPVFYGTLRPLANLCFEQDKIDPYGISAESGMLCFSTSRQEATERYATPPMIDPEASFDQKMIAYKSEWFSKTSAIACKMDNVAPGGSPSQETLNRVRREINQKAEPTVYEVMVLLTKPFVVDRNIPVYSGKMTQNYKNEMVERYGEQSHPVSLDSYEQPLRVCLMTMSPKKMSMADTVSIVDKFMSGMLRGGVSHMNTHALYNEIKNFLGQYGIGKRHAEVFNCIHDGIILNHPGIDFANADYGDNKHVMVFDVDRVYFRDFEMSNRAMRLKAYGELIVKEHESTFQF